MNALLKLRLISVIIMFFVGLISLYTSGSNLLGNLFISASILSYYLYDFLKNKRKVLFLEKFIIILTFLLSAGLIVFNNIDEYESNIDLNIFPCFSLFIGIVYLIFIKKAD